MFFAPFAGDRLVRAPRRGLLAPASEPSCFGLGVWLSLKALTLFVTALLLATGSMAADASFRPLAAILLSRTDQLR